LPRPKSLTRKSPKRNSRCAASSPRFG
jgi:hypothetical protein